MTDRCLPNSPTFMMFDGTDFEIRQFGSVVLLLFESDHWVRRVYLDGRGHPSGYAPTWMGHSDILWASMKGTRSSSKRLD